MPRRLSVLIISVNLAAEIVTSDGSEFIGRSFNLTFNNLLSGHEISTFATDMEAGGVEIIGIPQDERPEQVLSLCNRFGITWLQYMESGRSFNKPTTVAWKITHTPDFILLDSTGRVLEYGFSDPTAACSGVFQLRSIG